LYLLTPLIIVRLLWRGVKAREYLSRWGERFGVYGIYSATSKAKQKSIKLWIHTVSVGEFIATVPLLEHLLNDKSNYNLRADELLITTTTPTGSARVVEFLNRFSAHHVYLPYDQPGAVNRFLKNYQPLVGVIMETELWPNLFHSCAKRNIPVLLANARLSQRSQDGYKRWIPKLAYESLQSVTSIMAQSQDDAKRIVALGADSEKVVITGSIKFDMQLPDDIEAQGEKLRRELGGERPVWIAASTREGEDEQILAAHKIILDSVSDALLILVPRHPERFNSVAKLVKKLEFKLQRRSIAGDNCSCADDVQVYLGDTMGELLQLYSAADIAYVGGSLVATGSHNMLEPAALGKPVLFGPHRFNFADISKMLLEQEAAYEVLNHTELANRVIFLAQNSDTACQMGERGRLVVEKNRGALKRLLVEVYKVLKLKLV